jgi:hypothetical protein
MPSDDASGLTQGARRLSDTARGWINSIPTPQRRPDTSWNDDMVRRANDSFREAAARAEAAAEAEKSARATAASTTPTRQPAKRTPKRPAPRPTPRPAGRRR